MKITKKIAEKLALRDDSTPFGGKAHSTECLDEFMESTSTPYGSTLEKVNQALKECGCEPYTEAEIIEAMKPHYFGYKPETEEWLDDDTFIVYFEERNSIEKVDGEKVVFKCQLYAEVHLDENNEVVIGENVYETTADGGEGDFIDTSYYEGAPRLEMSRQTAKKIKEYALWRLKEQK